MTRMDSLKIISSFLIATVLAVTCSVSSNKLTVINIPNCVGAIQVTFTQGAIYTVNGGVENGQAEFDDLGQKLKDAGFDLSEKIQVTVELKLVSAGCEDLQKVLNGEVKVEEDGDSQLDYNDLK